MNGVHCQTSATTTAAIGKVETQSMRRALRRRTARQIQLSVPLSRP